MFGIMFGNQVEGHLVYEKGVVHNAMKKEPSFQ